MQSTLLPSLRDSSFEGLYCSICHVSKTHFHCSTSSREQVSSSFKLWCNSWKLKNPHRTESGTQSGRHTEHESEEVSLALCQFLLVKIRANMRLLGVAYRTFEKEKSEMKGTQCSWSLEKTCRCLFGTQCSWSLGKMCRGPIWAEWLKG